MLTGGPIDEIHEGRWLSPDPMGGDITDPQSLNRYAYTSNNPTRLHDPTGLFGARLTAELLRVLIRYK